MRKLASIQTITNIEPIEGKDRIVLATVLGWHVIIRKDEYKVGDKCIYIEIDSVVPKTNPDFAFLESKNYRIKTMKMGGVRSEGLCMPLSILHFDNAKLQTLTEGQDVTDILGIIHYEDAQEKSDYDTQTNSKGTNKHIYIKYAYMIKKLLFGNKKDTSFPSFIHKTDEVRIQENPRILEDQNQDWVFTEKIDGTSATYAVTKTRNKFIPFMWKYTYYVCSRNRRFPVDDNSVYWKVYNTYRIKEALTEMIDSSDAKALVIQGEIIAPGIQKNKYQAGNPELYVFNIIYDNKRLGTNLMKERLPERFNVVPIIKKATKLPHTVDEMLNIAHGESMLAHITREGIVARSADGTKSFKAVDPEFLLKWGI